MDATQTSPPENTPRSSPTPSPPQFYNLLIQAASAVVFATFALYTIGFIIWRSYLATYGVYSVAFMQSDYIAGAFCYLLVSLVLALPPAIVFEHWRASRGGKKPNKEPIQVLQAIWFTTIIWLQTLFFPHTHAAWSSYFWLLIGFAFLWVVLYIIWALKWPEAGLTKLLRASDIKSGLFCVAIAIWFFSGTGLSMWFLVYTLLIYPIYFYLPGIRTPSPVAWAKSDLPVKVVFLGFAGLLLLLHVQLFGRTVFGIIPKNLGGGKPEKAFLHLDPQHVSLAEALNFGTTNESFLTNRVVGPVGIVLRTEREIIFVDYAQIGAPDMLTNLATNASQKFMTNQLKIVSTNITFSTVTNVTKNPLKAQRAKQVRADIVDAVVFSE